jgi:tripeptidyl-peptidase-1
MGVDWHGYINRTNIEFSKLGVLGVSLVVASGDSGCHGRTDEHCLLGKEEMHPDYPAACPFATSVGGTALAHPQLTNTSAEPICAASGGRSCAAGLQGAGAESVCEKPIVSGGGFSSTSPQPAYQTGAVDAYLNGSTGAQMPNAKNFNAAGRGYPDVAALAPDYYIAVNGQIGSASGTSCATPVVAGMLALLNADRAARGQPNVGFANPLLYRLWAGAGNAAGGLFNDVTVGNNRCSEAGCHCKQGFDAAKGWDATTGLGSLNYGNILTAVQTMDAEREERRAAA